MQIYLAFVIVTALAVPVIEGMKCHIMLDMVEDKRAIINDCHKNHRNDYKKFPGMNTTLEDYDFDDNCQSQCVYKGMDVLTAEGNVKKDALAIPFKLEELDADIVEKLKVIWNGCVDEAEKIGKTKGIKDCKLLALHSFCINKKLSANEKIWERKCC